MQYAVVVVCRVVWLRILIQRRDSDARRRAISAPRISFLTSVMTQIQGSECCS